MLLSDTFYYFITPLEVTIGAVQEPFSSAMGNVVAARSP